MNICIYLRKSRSEENLSVEEVLNRHRTTLLAYAQKHKHNILDIKEEVVSGESITRRPKMLELLQEVEDNKYDAVLVMDVDRLGRGNMREQGLILETFKEYNTKIITPNKIYDLANNEFDEEYSEFEAFMARRELKIIKKRLQRGKMKSLQEGNYIASIAPFGYEKKGTALTINKKQADTVRLIFDLYINKGLGDSKIANYLIENKIPNANDNLNWDKATIRTILKNPVYTGKVVWGKKKFRYDDEGNRKSKLKDKEDWIIHEGKHDAIIDDATFEKAQKTAKLRNIPHTGKSKGLRNPLAGLIKCGSCNSTMTIRTNKNKHDSIRCYQNCGGVKSSYIHLIEEKTLEIVLKQLEELKLKLKIENKKNNLDSEIKVIENTLNTKQNELNTLNNQKEKLYDLLEQGIYDNEVFLERMNTLSQKINIVENDINDLNKKLSDAEEDIMIKDNILPQINNSIKFIKTIYNKLSAKEKNEFLKSVIDKIIYNKDKKAGKKDFSLDIYMKI